MVGRTRGFHGCNSHMEDKSCVLTIFHYLYGARKEVYNNKNLKECVKIDKISGRGTLKTSENNNLKRFKQKPQLFFHYVPT